jgi:hypothetical protein
MNRYLAAWGALIAAGGVAMYSLLQALGAETFFMAAFYIPPAQEVAAGVVLAGIVMLIASAIVEWPRYSAVSNEVAARYFARLALANSLAAAVFASAMLIPPLELPILFTEWPGIYIAIAFGSFVGFGVLGMLAWALMYQMLPNFFSRSSLDRRSVILQLLLSEVGIFGVSTILFLAGFTGASLVHDSLAGSVVIGASMEFADIPAAASIFVVIVSVFLGAISILGAKKHVEQP